MKMMKYSNNNAEEGEKREKNTKESAAVLLLSVESQRELKEIELLRAHILSYRTSTSSTFAPTSSSSRAVKCTIAALDMERDQIMRNEKLKRKPSRVMKPIKRKPSRVMKPILKIGMKPSKLKDDYKVKEKEESEEPPKWFQAYAEAAVGRLEKLLNVTMEKVEELKNTKIEKEQPKE
jgi:hypothetical protein